MVYFFRYLRDCCSKIVGSSLFEWATIIVIMFNCVMLAITNPNNEQTPAEKNIDFFFLVFYSSEMVLKIIAMGFILSKNSYLRDIWNILDFAIVLSTYTIYLPVQTINIQGLRTLRILRPLRTISSVKALRMIMNTLISAIPLLRDVFLILFLFFLIFAIAGLQLFAGLLKQRCFSPETGMLYLDSAGSSMLCGYSSCPSGYVCGKTTANPDFNVSSFDTVFSALILVFQMVTMENWSTIMLYLETTFMPLPSLFYSAALVLIGGFFLLNLFLAVIKAVFTTTQQHQFLIKTTHEEKFQDMLMKQKHELVKLMRNHRTKLFEFNKVMILDDGEIRKVDKRLLAQAKKQEAKKRKEKRLTVRQSQKKSSRVSFKKSDESSSESDNEKCSSSKLVIPESGTIKSVVVADESGNASPTRSPTRSIIKKPQILINFIQEDVEKENSLKNCEDDSNKVFKPEDCSISALEKFIAEGEKLVNSVKENGNELGTHLPNQPDITEELT